MVFQKVSMRSTCVNACTSQGLIFCQVAVYISIDLGLAWLILPSSAITGCNVSFDTLTRVTVTCRNSPAN